MLLSLHAVENGNHSALLSSSYFATDAARAVDVERPTVASTLSASAIATQTLCAVRFHQLFVELEPERLRRVLQFFVAAGLLSDKHTTVNRGVVKGSVAQASAPLVTQQRDPFSLSISVNLVEVSLRDFIRAPGGSAESHADVCSLYMMVSLRDALFSSAIRSGGRADISVTLGDLAGKWAVGERYPAFTTCYLVQDFLLPVSNPYHTLLSTTDERVCTFIFYLLGL